MTKEAIFMIAAWIPYIFGWTNDLWLPLWFTAVMVAYAIVKVGSEQE
jgi:hypothetical protein